MPKTLEVRPLKSCECGFVGTELDWDHSCVWWRERTMGVSKNPNAVALGALGNVKGGQSTSQAKQAASRLNGRKGGRPRRYCGPCDAYTGSNPCKACGAETERVPRRARRLRPPHRPRTDRTRHAPAGTVGREHDRRIVPLAIDLFCGLGGWTDGLLAEGWRVVGFDVERHRYPARDFTLAEEHGKGMAGKNKNGTTLINAAREQVHGYHTAPLTGGWIEYPAQLVLQDVLTIHGSQLKSAALIVASPPCQEFSYMAMPWSRAKEKAAALRDGRDDPKRLTALFDACFRIQREAIEAAGHFIPLVVENVRGAQPWVGRARWHFGSFYLWGDVPALMPMTKARAKVGGFSWSDHGKPDYKPMAFNGEADKRLCDDTKNDGGSWFAVAHNTTSGKGQNPVEHFKLKDDDGYERNHPQAFGWKAPRTTSKGTARKAASAHIAKIPEALARHIARVYHPDNQ